MIKQYKNYTIKCYDSSNSLEPISDDTLILLITNEQTKTGQKVYVDNKNDLSEEILNHIAKECIDHHISSLNNSTEKEH